MHVLELSDIMFFITSIESFNTNSQVSFSYSIAVHELQWIANCLMNFDHI